VPNAHASPSRRLRKIGGPNGAHFQNVDAIGRTWNCERNAYNWKLNGATRIGAVNGKGVVRTVDAVMARLRAEFMEMPGLRLTGARVVLKLRSWISHSPALTRLIARTFARMRRRPRACPRGAYCERAPRFARSGKPTTRRAQLWRELGADYALARTGYHSISVSAIPCLIEASSARHKSRAAIAQA
jgi:hypothetical protein